MSAEARIAELEAQVQELKKQLLHAQRLISVGVLASSITHEFNNILTTVINYAKLGLRHKDGPARERAFDKILQAGQRASRITTGMLAFARRGADRRDALCLVDIVAQVLVLVEKDLHVHRMRLETEYESRPVAIVNATQLQQVILNLIVNARQAMPSPGTITVSVRSNLEAGFAEIAIKDTGAGIPPETLKRLFEPFFTTKEADDKGQGGTGLGLSLAREVIEAHHGRIRVETALGRGTTFTLKLPLHSVEPPLSAAKSTAPAAAPAPV